MSVTSKTTSLQAYNLLLYRKALHPEFFAVDGRRRVDHGDYELEAWIFKGGHVVRFQHGGLCVCEVVAEHFDHLPEKGRVNILPCAGEHDHEEKVSEQLTYMTSMQTETLSDHLYLGTYREMVEHAKGCDGLLVTWDDSARKPNLSLVDIQRYRTEVHVQSYHLRSDCGLVLRTQSLFQVNVAKPVAAIAKD
jgi:hypothetical protein